MAFLLDYSPAFETICTHIIVTSLFAIGFMGFLSTRFTRITDRTNLQGRQN